MFASRHLIEPDDFTLAELEILFDTAQKMVDNPKEYADICHGKLLGSLFFEPSTRTRLSFEAAMLRLGGLTLGFSEPGSSSASKGESLADSIRTVSNYTDLIVMRNPKEGSALLASRFSDVPIINAGDGGHHHPTQTLTDLFTIRHLHRMFTGLTVGFCGDLKFGRTVHSLSQALCRYTNVKMVFVSPVELRVPDYITKGTLEREGISYSECEKLEDIMGELDVLYMTRVQRERFFNEEDYIRLKDTYILTKEKMKKGKDNLIVLHPLPRVNEISVEVDSDPRAAYFTQVKYGMYVRMALIAGMLGLV